MTQEKERKPEDERSISIREPLSMEREQGQYKIYDRSGQLLVTVARRAETVSDKDPAKILAERILERLSLTPSKESEPSINSEMLDVLKAIRRHGIMENEDYEYLVNRMGNAIERAEYGLKESEPKIDPIKE